VRQQEKPVIQGVHFPGGYCRATYIFRKPLSSCC